MDKQFIDTIVGAYFIDNRITESENLNKKHYSDLVLESVRELRDSDIELYNEIYDCSRLCQQKFMKSFLDLEIYQNNDDVLEESFITGGLTALLLLTAGHLWGGKISNTTFKLLNDITDKWNRFFTFVSKLGRSVRIRYAIIQKNQESCYVRCGIKKEDMKLSHYAGVSTNIPVWGNWSSTEKIETARCLRNCFIENVIYSIDLFMENYFECLQKSGVTITNAEDDIMKFIDRLGTSNVCSTFYKNAKEVFDIFEKTIDMVFTPPYEQEKQNAYKLLKERLYKTRIRIESNKRPNFQKR